MIGMGPCWLVLGYDCNNRCRWCYADQVLTSSKRMDSKILLDSLNLLESMKVSECVLIGGEPTVSELLSLAIKEAKERTIEPTVVTNGRRMSDWNYASMLRNSGLDKVSISVESTNRLKHDFITRKRGSFEQTVGGIKNAVSLGMKVDTVTTISFENLNEVIGMIEFAKLLGVTSVGFNVETPNVDNPRASKLTITRAVETMNELFHEAESQSIAVHFAASIPLCMLPEAQRDDSHFRGSCFVYYGDGLVVDANGSIIPCVHWIGAEIDSIYTMDGSPKTAQEFFDGWNIGPAKEFRDSLWEYPSESCTDCQHWEAGKCTGGCPLLRLNRDLSEEIDLPQQRAKGGIK